MSEGHLPPRATSRPRLTAFLSPPPLLRKIAQLPGISPREGEAAAVVLRVFDGLPRVSEEWNCISIDLSGPRRRYGEHEISHWWRITVGTHDVQVSSGCHFYPPYSDGDSFTCMEWRASVMFEGFFADRDPIPRGCKIALVSLDRFEPALVVGAAADEADVTGLDREDVARGGLVARTDSALVVLL